jgi:hypothetical protein
MLLFKSTIVSYSLILSPNTQLIMASIAFCEACSLIRHKYHFLFIRYNFMLSQGAYNKVASLKLSFTANQFSS